MRGWWLCIFQTDGVVLLMWLLRRDEVSEQGPGGLVPATCETCRRMVFVGVCLGFSGQTSECRFEWRRRTLYLREAVIHGVRGPIEDAGASEIWIV